MSSKHRIPFTVTPHAESQPEACNLQASPPSAHSSAAAALMRRRLLQPGSLCDLHAPLSLCPSHKSAVALCVTGKFRRRNPVALAKAVPCSMHAERLHLRHTPVDTHVFRAACTTKRNTKRAQQVSLASCWLAVCKAQETDSGRIDHGGLGFRSWGPTFLGSAEICKDPHIGTCVWLDYLVLHGEGRIRPASPGNHNTDQPCRGQPTTSSANLTKPRRTPTR